jgi:hypothetical protein
MWPDRNLFITQLTLMTQRKNAEETWLTIMATSSSAWLSLFITYGLTTLWFLYHTIKQPRHQENRLIALVLTAAWLIALVGKMEWYYFYLFPFIYLALNRLAVGISAKSYLKFKLLLLLITGLSLYLTQRSNTFITHGSYTIDRHYEEILAAVPDNTSVFLSSIPDPYFAFIEDKRRNHLVEFPTLPASTKIYEEILAEIDYVIYNNNYDHVLFGDFLPNYLQNYTESFIPVTRVNSKITQTKRPETPNLTALR